MPPAIHARSDFLGRSDPAIRNVVVPAFAALGGVIIGGLSVLGIVVAVTQPPAKDAPAGSAVFDGPHVVDARPPAASAQPGAPLASQAASVQALPPAPVQAQAPSAADVLRETWPVNTSAAKTSLAKTSPAKTWPDTLSARVQRAPDATVTTEQTPASPPPAMALNAQGINIGDDDSNNGGQDAAANVANRAHQRRASHLAASRNLAPLSLAPNAHRSGRIVMGPADDQQARSGSEDEASSQGARPLFDFYGSPRQQRVIDRDQNMGYLPAQNDNWGSFFGHDNWNDDQRD